MGSKTSAISAKDSIHISSGFLLDCRNALEQLGSKSKQHSVTASIKYLQQKDVIEQFAKILTNFPIDNEMKLRICSTLGVTYAEILLTDKSGQIWIANFLPCDACAWVTLRKYDNDD